MSTKSLSIGIVIPTYQAARHLPHCLPYLIQSPLKPRILVLDSSSGDDTIRIAKQFGVETLVIPQAEFNHGLTREKGRHYLNTDIVVMITQDAYPTSIDMLEHLVKPLMTEKASVAYARQLAHKRAGFFESFPRSFNYPPQSHVRSLKDISTYGVYSFFCSNSCAAYSNKALNEVGGFPFTLFGEDTIVVAKLLHKNHSIAYVAEAEIRHSHHYTLKQEFHRHFDIGLARQSYKDLITVGGKDTKRGATYFKTLLKQLYKENPKLIPYAFIQTVVKFTGYKLGQWSAKAPVWLKKYLSSQKYFWK